MKTRISYTVSYTPAGLARKISDLMSRCDLGVQGIGFTEECSWTTTTTVDAAYIKKMTKAVKEGFESTGAVVHDVQYLHHKILQ